MILKYYRMPIYRRHIIHALLTSVLWLISCMSNVILSNILKDRIADQEYTREESESFSKSSESNIFLVEMTEQLIPRTSWPAFIKVSTTLRPVALAYRDRNFGAHDTDPLQLIAHDILEFVLYQTELHHRVAGEYGAAEGEAGIVGASLPPAGLPLGLDLRALAGTA